MKGSSRIAACLALFLMMSLAAFAGDNSMFNYQGRVLVQGFPYTGAGQMKVAILATTGTSTVYSLWSNDGSSKDGVEPTGSFGVTATGGVFDVMVGDTDLMNEIPAIIFNREDELKVRVWFNDGTHGFQQLVPDRRITNPRRLGLTRINSPLWVYVNSTTGSDMNTGLTTDTAKCTVQAAIDMLPRSVHAPTTIKIAAGTYPCFTVSGFKDITQELLIMGDMVHDPTLSQALDVIVAGTGGSQIGMAAKCSDMIRVKGILFDTWHDGVNLKDSEVEFDRCQANNCSYMGFLAELSRMTLNKCLAYHNGQYGIGYVFSTGGLVNTISDGNTNGLMVYHNSSVYCIPATLRNNGTGLVSRYLSSIVTGTINYSGNGTNTNIAAGSGIY